jgi:hypothetical protein
MLQMLLLLLLLLMRRRAMLVEMRRRGDLCELVAKPPRQGAVITAEGVGGERRRRLNHIGCSV